MRNKIVSSILVLQMILCPVMLRITTGFAFDKEINIETKEDFIKFSNNCTLDSWSKGKTVNLTSNIDFSGVSFSSVPSFGGTFNGNGYTISGITYKGKGSYKGVFRYVEEGGKISDLNINADFLPGGSKSFLGGIVGENSGTIENCSFSGTLKGENVIGGIAGNNTQYGQIISCNSSGSITGENSTGGIAGKNSGFIQNCTNDSSVNTAYEEKKKSISDIETDTDAIIENRKSLKEENQEESILGHTDTGGIAGYTSGIIQGCVNNGEIGYKHIGYNVGGISGRQSGYILGCKNYGFVRGRKDVGGIVGQAEPYILLQTSESNLQSLKSELKSLSAMINRFISDADNLEGNTRGYLDNISKYANEASDNTQKLLNKGIDFADDNLSEINAQAAILSNTLDKLVVAFEGLKDGGDNLSKALNLLSDAVKNFNADTPGLSEDLNSIASSLSRIAKSSNDIKKAISKAKRATMDLENAIQFNNATDVKNAASNLSSSLDEIISAKESTNAAIEQIQNILSAKPDGFENIGVNAGKIIENLNIISSNTNKTIGALKSVSSSLETIILSTKINFSEFRSAAENITVALDYLSNASYYIFSGLKGLAGAISDFSEKIDGYTDNINAVLKSTSEALDALSYAGEDITNAISDIKDIISDLSKENQIEFVKLGDDFKSASNGLFDSLSGISNEINGLKNIMTSENKKIKGDLTSISNQFNLVMNLLIGEVENLKLGADSLSDIFIDVSDEEIENARQGKIAECQNCGCVESDRNTGGVVGNMAIEYSKDPEDETEKPDTLNFTYRTKAILHSCINNGKIKGKKDCVGGIVGLSEIGTVYKCENYGDSESASGNYVGGIAGKSESSIRKCYAKSHLSGNRYIGGIAGKANTIASSYTIVTVSGEENIGSVCGYSESRSNLHHNYYVDNSLGALDGISYKEQAESISFNQLINIDEIPVRFISFSVTFIADDKIVETQDIKYGSVTKRIKYPKIPKKEGFFGNWEKITARNVTENITVKCEYQPYITIISSIEKNKSGKLALALAEGEFTDKSKLHILESKENPPVRKGQNIKVYDISLTDTDIKSSEPITVRLLNENKDKVTIWQFNNGKWNKIKASRKGKYVICQVTGPQSTVCIKYEKHFLSIVWIILILAVITSVCVFFIRHKV